MTHRGAIAQRSSPWIRRQQRTCNSQLPHGSPLEAVLQLSPVSTETPTSSTRPNIAFEAVLAQVREEDNDDNETLNDTICKEANSLQAAVAEIVPARNANNKDHVHRLATPAEYCAGDADAEDIVGDESNQGNSTDGVVGIGESDGVGYRDADVDVGDGGHINRDADSNMKDEGESDRNGDRDDNSDDQVVIATVGLKLDIVFHGSDDHDNVLDDDNATAPDLFCARGHIQIWKCFWLLISEEKDLSVSDLATDEIDMLQTETIVISRTKYRHLYHCLHMVLTWDRFLSFFKLDGKVRLSEAQYANLRGAINTQNRRIAMLEMCSTRKTLRPALHGYCYPKCEVIPVQVNSLVDLCTGASYTVQPVNRGEHPLSAVYD